MGSLHHLAPRRLLFGDTRGHGLGLSWHEDAGFFVVSVWDGERCMGTVRLEPAQAARLTAALTERLAEHLGRAEAEPANPEAVGL